MSPSNTFRPRRFAFLRTLRSELLEVRQVLSAEELSFGIQASSARIEPPKQTETQFVIDDASLGGDLDAYTYRSGGPLLINVAPTRYIGDAEKLLANGMLPSTIRLSFPAYDVDAHASGDPEIDRVYFIDGDGMQHDLSTTLNGDNNIWHDNFVTIQTSWLDFGSLSRAGSDAIGTFIRGASYLKIDIDTLNAGWAVSIDWVSYVLEVPNPVMFVHGILSDPSTWVGPFTSQLDDAGIPYYRADVGATDSIANNAQKLETYYQQMRGQWSVDPNQGFRLDLITHSHGGLDARHWVENRDRVDQLFQLGTPNAGSPLADAVQAGLPFLIGIPLSALTGYLAPTSRELTTGFMADYNKRHGLNPNVSYTVYGGDYKDTVDGSGLTDKAAAALLGGANDQIVPLWSAFAIAGMTKGLFATIGDLGNVQAKHTEMTKSQSLATAIIPQLFRKASSAPLSTQAFAQDFAATAATGAAIGPPGKSVGKPPSATSTDPASKTGLVGQGETKLENIILDNGSGVVRFRLTYQDGDVDFELTDPDGTQFTEASLAGGGAVKFSEDRSVPGLVQKVFQFTAGAKVGTWQVKVLGSQLPPGATSAVYILGADQSTSKIGLTAGTDAPNATVVEDTPFIVTAKLRNGAAPIKDAAVMGTLRAPDGSLTFFTMSDDGLNGDAKRGDGVYAAKIAQSLPSGLYAVRVFARNGSGAAFERESIVQVAVAAKGTSVTGATATQVDENSNGMADLLRTRVQVTAGAAGYYRLTATLADPSGKAVETVTVATQLVKGSNVVDLEFDGARIYARKKDGVFSLRNVKLEQEVEGLFAVAYAEPGVEATLGTRRFNDFEHVRMSLGKGGKSVVVDTDRDKLIDQLNFTFPIVTDTAGTYTFSASLVDDEGAIVTTASGTQDFKTGSNNVVFSFAGTSIFQRKLDGPYHVAGILIDGPAGVLRADTVLKTKSMFAGGFETGHTMTKAVLQVTPPAVAGTAVDEVVVKFSSAVDAASFTIADLTLTQGRTTVVLPGTVTVNRIDALTFAVRGLSAVASAKGSYKLDLAGRKVLDASGYSLLSVYSAKWTVRA